MSDYSALSNEHLNSILDDLILRNKELKLQLIDVNQDIFAIRTEIFKRVSGNYKVEDGFQ